MNNFAISSLPFKDVICDLANEMNTTYEENCKIYTVVIPARYGHGNVTGIDFDDGLGLIQYNCNFLEDTQIEFSVDEVHPVKFLVCQQGQIWHKFLNEPTRHDIPQYKNAIVASSSHHGHMIGFKAGNETLFTSLELDRNRFQSKISCELDSATKEWSHLIKDVHAKETFYHDGFFSLQCSEILKEYKLYENNDFVRKIHLEGLAYKVLVLQIVQFEDDVKSEGNKTLLRSSELNLLKKALREIDDNLEDLPPISQIASHVGLSSKKLQQGFQEVFGKSVNDYVSEKRLELIRVLLANSENSLSTIASIVGYKSKSYLSKVFKKEYGIQPSEFRKNLLEQKITIDSLTEGTTENTSSYR
ncbi:helix-turn-helix domain-containing protein [Maribacter sp. X9]|uniref:helix-turn-helix domain-containing protein n=1 Tax=Maribacter sp. X9 TaxID=3402159 RepID=UPI003AF3CB83